MIDERPPASTFHPRMAPVEHIPLRTLARWAAEYEAEKRAHMERKRDK